MELLLLPFYFMILLLLILTSSSSSSHVRASSKHDNSTDLQALLNFQAHADPNGVLSSNWTISASSFCDWKGVYCSHRRQRISAIVLRDLPLQGTTNNSRIIPQVNQSTTSLSSISREAKVNGIASPRYGEVRPSSTRATLVPTTAPHHKSYMEISG